MDQRGAGDKFPRSFWTANVTELFERAAYYAVASFVVLYLGRLGLGDYWPSTLNGLMWAILYFLPILSGTVADQVGFRRALLACFVLLGAGYFLMGFPVWFGGTVLETNPAAEVTAGAGVLIPVLLGILLIGVGGSVVKPCISGTVQKTGGRRRTLAFAIFYMVINIGSLAGRGVSYGVRTTWGLSGIFAVGAAFSVIAFLTVLFIYRDPEVELGAATPVEKPRRSVRQILTDMVVVLRNRRFAMFLLVSSGFFFLYAQVYNVLPLYLKKVVETDPAVDIYTMANPLVIVAFQLLITKLFGGMKPIRSIIVGTIIIGLSMAVNILPILIGDLRGGVFGLLPIGALVVVLTVALVAFGELFTSARTYEYIGALAPKGQEGLFLGYASLPMAIGALIGGPAGAFIVNEVILRDATPRADGLLDPDPTWNAIGWLILMSIGFLSAASMWLYNRWIERTA